MSTGAMTTVKIYDREFSIVSDLRSEYLTQLASYIDAKMREVAQEESMVSLTRLAMLALLNIADELFQQKKTQEELVDLVDAKIAQILDIISTDEKKE